MLPMGQRNCQPQLGFRLRVVRMDALVLAIEQVANECRRLEALAVSTIRKIRSTYTSLSRLILSLATFVLTNK